MNEVNEMNGINLIPPYRLPVLQSEDTKKRAGAFCSYPLFFTYPFVKFVRCPYSFS